MSKRENEESRRENRRRFLKDAVKASLAGAGCLAGLQAAFAQARRDRKPLLTQDRLNRFLEQQSAENLQEIFLEALHEDGSIDDDALLDILQESFTLTKRQQERLLTLSERNAATLEAAATLILAGDATVLRAVLGPPRGGDVLAAAGGSLMVETLPQTESLRIIIYIECD